MSVIAGTDFFQTPPGGANFQFPNFLQIPGDFFDKGSAPFTGLIEFQGVPIPEYTDPRSKKKYSTGGADTIIRRPQDAVIQGTSGSATIQIEMVALSLRSTSPIEVQVGNRVQRWEVYVSLSPSAPSTGTMTFTQTSASGGHFASQLQPVPLFHFVRSDGIEKTLDLGKMQIPDEKRALVTRLTTVESSEVPFVLTPAPGEVPAAAVTGNLAITQTIFHVGPHPVLKAVTPVLV
jgi:hypothetical protein